jgi:hypothetical protein
MLSAPSKANPELKALDKGETATYTFDRFWGGLEIAPARRVTSSFPLVGLRGFGSVELEGQMKSTFPRFPVLSHLPTLKACLSAGAVHHRQPLLGSHLFIEQRGANPKARIGIYNLIR